jgi:poly-gamma-glutamate capsule biosynthesis protein CapA/YwtB (metallophosphatase superfamily)
MQWIVLGGDAMLGRGVDQIQAVSCDPLLPNAERRDAREFVHLAEALNGPIPRPVAPDYVWGEALEALAPFAPALRLLNLENAITTTSNPAPKSITERMHPHNVAVLRAFGVDCCVLANNHVLDWSEDGLRETLSTLDAAGIARAGAGLDADDAWQPAILPLPDGTRAIVLSLGDTSSGIPAEWAATADRPGLAVLEQDLAPSVARAEASIARAKRAGDIAIASIHWGGNWGFNIPARQVELAKALIDRAAIDVVHGHSSHHPKQVGLYRGKFVLFGCSDLINDYEGLRRNEQLRPDLVTLHLIGVEGGAVRDLRILPLRIRRMRLQRATSSEARWLCRQVTGHSATLGVAWQLAPDGTIRLARLKRPREGGVSAAR